MSKTDFFKRKETDKVDLPEQNLVVDSNSENPVATVTKMVEEAFTHRELAFLLSKDLLQIAYQQSVESIKTKK